ncbi:MAG: hypothetical protein E7568_06535 [Ruminococcaceae bacterium]|nr:hypothetical protein [Oscillospiraceae bacterium]
MEFFVRGFISVVRYVLPVLSVLLLSVSAIGLLKKRFKPYKLVLNVDGLKEIPLSSGEYLMGSSSECDIVISGLKKKHAVLSISNNYMTIRPTNKSKIKINEKIVKGEKKFAPNDSLTMEDRELSVIMKINKDKSVDNRFLQKAIVFSCLNIIQIFVFFCLVFAFKEKATVLFICFGTLIIGEWIYLFITRFLCAFIEIPVLFLFTFGLSVAAHGEPSTMIKQLLCFAVGFVLAILLEKILIKPSVAIGFKGIALIVGIGLFVINIIFGVVYNGSQNWINVLGYSVQPSEFIKVILIFISGAAADKINDKKDILPFSLFTIISLLILAYLSDFGTALIYAVCAVSILFIRLCSFKLLGILSGGAVIFGGTIMLIFPYVAKRIFSFGSAFENASDSGYQQTRTIIAAASGGLFGIGGGRGSLVKIPAYDTDIVFGLITEEWGLIIGICVLFCFVIFAIYAVKTLTVSSSNFYSTTCCAAAVLLLAQTALNVFGSMDMLPFTGVTLPFISVGGSSVIACTVIMSFFRVAVRDEHIILIERRRKIEKA